MKSIVKSEVLHSDWIAIADDRGKKITYQGLAEQAEKLASSMEERSFIFILCDHQIETAEFLYEVFYLNQVPLLLSHDMGWELIEHLLICYKPQYIYCRKGHEASKQYPCELEWEFHVLLRTGEDQTFFHPDIALLLSTSGTTGSPKLVKLSYDNLYSNAEEICKRMGMQERQTGLSPLAMNYVYGLNFCIWHWHCGGTLLLTEESILSNKFNEFFVKEKINHFVGTPHIYQMLDRLCFWDSQKLGYLHWVMSGGAQMSDETQRKMVILMKEKFWMAYGQTECTGTISVMNFDLNHIKVGAVGKVLQNTVAEIDEKTKELILKTRNVCMGYARSREQLADGDTNHGILHTGDVAYLDEEGCIYLKGRLSRHVKILGKRVSLDDVEKYLSRKYSNMEFACTGEDEYISVFYSGKDGTYENQQEYLLHFKSEIPMLIDTNMKIPKKFIRCSYLEEIPRSSAGKIMYARLGEKSERKNIGNL